MSSTEYRLHHGDCLEILPTLADGSIDAIIADPPYGTTACKWDSVIPLEPMWAQLKRVIKPRGAIVLFAAQPFTSALVMSNAEWFRYAMVWRKTMPLGFMHAKNKPLNTHEDIVVFSGGIVAHFGKSESRMTYNPQMKAGKPYRKHITEKNRSGEHRWLRPSHSDYTLENDGERYPGSVIEYSNGNSNSQHPTQKPVDLLAYLIRTYTNEGETVLDFTMGSGSTGVAAMKEGRRFVGIELDAGYFDIAKRRIGEAVTDVAFGLFAEAAD